MEFLPEKVNGRSITKPAEGEKFHKLRLMLAANLRAANIMPILDKAESLKMLSVELVRKICLSFPKATEQLQWGDHLLFKIAGRMFAIASLEPSKAVLSFKVTPENFAELTERPDIVPAPYLARAYWIALESHHAMDIAEAEMLLRNSYGLVLAKQSKRIQESVAKTDRIKSSRSKSKSTRSKVPLKKKSKKTYRPKK